MCDKEKLDIVTPAELFQKTFLNGMVQNLLIEICNSRLLQLKEKFCTEIELLQAIKVVMAAAFYGRSVTKLLDVENEDLYNTPRVNMERILLIIRCMEGEQTEINGSHHSSVYSPSNDIERLGEAFSSIYCSLGYVPEMDLSADDDLTRQRSKRVSSSTELKQINIPGKGMGCVQTTVACPLTNITLSSRYSVRDESYSKTIQIRIRRIQMKNHQRLVDNGFLSMIYLDRGYVCDEVVMVLNDAKLHLVGTKKRGKGAHFNFG